MKCEIERCTSEATHYYEWSNLTILKGTRAIELCPKCAEVWRDWAGKVMQKQENDQ